MILNGKERALNELIVEAVTGGEAKFWKFRLRLGDTDPKQNVLLMKAV
jgi:hypothetical protein